MLQIKHNLLTVFSLCLTVLCTSCGEEPEAVVKDAYRMLTVERQDITLNREFAVTLESEHRIYVRTLVSGLLTKICVQEGARVKKGQPLFIIDQAPYIAAVDAAKAQVGTARAAHSTAQLNLEGKKRLYAQQIIGEFDLHRAHHASEEARAQVEAAQAELAGARTNLSYTTISSPVDGVIGMINHRVGDFVSPTDEKELTMINQNSNLRAYSILSEEMLSELLRDFDCDSYDELFKKLPPVTFYSNWGSQLPQEGRIDAISGSVEKINGATYIRASFRNPTEKFRSGTNGYIVLPYVMHEVIVIPQEAAVDINHQYLVYRVIDGKAVATEVTVMPYNDGHNFVVTNGLEPGDVIIAEGAGFVEDGMEVTEKKEKKGGKQS